MASTVFVVGAGASVPFGLPTSAQLKDEIMASPPDPYPEFERFLPYEQQGEIRRAAKHFGWDKHKFVQVLSTSGNATVDAWMEAYKNPWAQHYATYAIAAALLPMEFKLLGTPLLSGDWHAWLFRKLKSTKAVDLERLQIVTFNYDSLLEWAFVQMIASSFPLTRAQARDRVRQWNVEYVYGSLTGDLTAELADASKNYHFERAADAHKQIRLADERIGPNVDVATEARKRIWAADRIVFLGFGFDPTNLRVLGIDNVFPRWSAKKRTILGTAYGMGTAERQKAIDALGVGTVLGESGETCVSFLNDRVHDI